MSLLKYLYSPATHKNEICGSALFGRFQLNGTKFSPAATVVATAEPRLLTFGQRIMVYSVESFHSLTGYIKEVKKYWEHWLDILITPCPAFYSEEFCSGKFSLRIRCDWIVLPYELNIRHLCAVQSIMWFTSRLKSPPAPGHLITISLPPKLLGEEDTAVLKIYAIPEQKKTPGAENFFNECCRADPNEIIGYFKAHIYNKSSLVMVAQSFDVDDQPYDEGTSAKKAVDENEEGPEIIDTEEREDHALVQTKFVQALSQLQMGFGEAAPMEEPPHQNCQERCDRLQLSKWAHAPGEEQEPHPKGGSKGISNLTLAECSILVTAFNDTSKNRFHFKHVPELKADLMASRLPIIQGTAPDYDSPHVCGKQIFCNLKTDHLGLPKKVNIAATVVKKKSTGKPSCSIETISIPDSDDIEEIPKQPKVKARHSPPSIHDSDSIQEVAGP
ncbi:hypothetical protein PAXINDRAFT_18030 [Paxillus involutus ATCC 200175]|uniref:Uncharacterized protein n=1 Tax=Paxillus involutus ATCC 200175 TaxID=664439 RepID=A0A0C9SPC6_PAXIN|nr:hypothetical protein PAXINDRAFT_18030 [Paxillus involutus ATCC 200175]